MNEQNTRTPLYTFAVLHIIAVYAFVPLILLTLNSKESSALTDFLPALLPVLTGLLNLTAVLVCRKQTTREQLMRCTAAVKYALIPFFLIGGACIAIVLLMMFTPVVIMIFIAPVMALTFAAVGWIVMIGGAPFSVGYLIRSCREQVHPPLLLIAAGICQFIFTADVIAFMVLTLRERRFTKLTVGILVTLGVLLVGGIGALVIWIL